MFNVIIKIKIDFFYHYLNYGRQYTKIQDKSLQQWSGQCGKGGMTKIK